MGTTNYQQYLADIAAMAPDDTPADAKTTISSTTPWFQATIWQKLPMRHRRLQFLN